MTFEFFFEFDNKNNNNNNNNDEKTLLSYSRQIKLSFFVSYVDKI